MEAVSIFAVPLLFFIAIYFLVYKKDEKYLNAIGDRVRAQQMELRRIQIQVNSIHAKLEVIEQFSHSLRLSYTPKRSFLDEETNPGLPPVPTKRRASNSLARLEKEITSIKEILNLPEDDPF